MARAKAADKQEVCVVDSGHPAPFPKQPLPLAMAHPSHQKDTTASKKKTAKSTTAEPKVVKAAAAAPKKAAAKAKAEPKAVAEKKEPKAKSTATKVKDAATVEEGHEAAAAFLAAAAPISITVGGHDFTAAPKEMATG